MLALPHTNSWGFIYTNEPDGSTPVQPGQDLTPGASNVEGAFVEIGPDASITTDILYATFVMTGGAQSGQAKNQLLDIAYDPTGGTTYDKFVFQDLAVGSSNFSHLARPFHFPCKIPAGSAIAARVQGSNATAGTVGILAHFYGKPSRPELWRPAAYSETLGYSSGSLGTSFTPGNGTFGSWASLGTTTKKHFWAQLGVQIDNGTILADGMRVQLGIGDGSSAMHVIIDQYMITSTGEAITHSLQQPCTWEIPSGVAVYVRGSNEGAPVTGYNATAVLFGG